MADQFELDRLLSVETKIEAAHLRAYLDVIVESGGRLGSAVAVALVGLLVDLCDTLALEPVATMCQIMDLYDDGEFSTAVDKLPIAPYTRATH